MKRTDIAVLLWKISYFFDDMNRNKKNVSFKKSAAEYMETGIPDWK